MLTAYFVVRVPVLALRVVYMYVTVYVYYCVQQLCSALKLMLGGFVMSIETICTRYCSYKQMHKRELLYFNTSFPTSPLYNERQVVYGV